MLVFTLGSMGTQAQILGGIFSQNKTQTKLLVQQIAALKVYAGYLEKGYSIAKGGLNTISAFKNGEFGLHKTFFNSLKYVNPKIKQYPKITDIIQMQVEIISIYGECYRKVKDSGAFSPEEIKYIYEVFGRVLQACEASIGELIDLVTDGKLEMKDDERIERMDQLYLDVEDMYTFSNHFSAETLQLGATRIHDQQELNIMKEWYHQE